MKDRTVPKAWRIGRCVSLIAGLVALASCAPAPAPGPQLATQCKTPAPAPVQEDVRGLQLDGQRGCIGARWQIPSSVHLHLLGGRSRERAIMRLPASPPEGLEGRPSLSGEAELQVAFKPHGGFERQRDIAMLVRGARPDPSGREGYSMARGMPYESGLVPVVLWRTPGESFAECTLVTHAGVETFTGQCTVHSPISDHLLASHPMNPEVALRMGLEDGLLVDRIRALMVPAEPAPVP